MANDILMGIWPDWKIEQEIGRGGYGRVYRAVRKDHEVVSHAAIKVINIPDNPSELASLKSEGMSEEDARTYFQEVVREFVSEIQLMDSFKGTAHIVSVEDYKVVAKPDEIGWTIFIRMELLKPFTQYIQEHTMSEREVLKLGFDICSALELCSRRNVIHRDIKPENIFINDYGDYKLGDFGIARKLEGSTVGMSQKGTYYYMAPEVEKSSKYDASVDQYSLGLVLYRLLNRNMLPFMSQEQQRLSPAARMAAVRTRLDGGVILAPSMASPEAAEVILRAVAYDPAKRFPDARTMKRAINAVAMGSYKLSGHSSDRKNVGVDAQLQVSGGSAQGIQQNPGINLMQGTGIGQGMLNGYSGPVQINTGNFTSNHQRNTTGYQDQEKKDPVKKIILLGCTIFIMLGLLGILYFSFFYDRNDTVPVDTQTEAEQTADEVEAIIENAEGYININQFSEGISVIETGLITHPDDERLLNKKKEYEVLWENSKKAEILYEQEEDSHEPAPGTTNVNSVVPYAAPPQNNTDIGVDEEDDIETQDGLLHIKIHEDLNVNQ